MGPNSAVDRQPLDGDRDIAPSLGGDAIALFLRLLSKLAQHFERLNFAVAFNEPASDVLDHLFIAQHAGRTGALPRGSLRNQLNLILY
jgi:hypothetical protein